MRILITSWKDIRHPLSGGAEIVTQQLSQELVKSGHAVTIFTARPAELNTREKIKGVTIIRRGNFLSVYLYALCFYLKNQHSLDLVIDQIHGIPFFTKLYVRKPIIAQIFEVPGRIWVYERPLFSGLGQLVEQLYFFLYRKNYWLTHSASTENDLRKKGIRAKKIYLLPLTISPPVTKPVPKTKIPTLIYLGRLTPMKRIDWLIKSLKDLKISTPEIDLIIIGRGHPHHVMKLKNLVNKLHLKKQVVFLGRVSEARKYQLLGRAWINVVPSVKEGFGLTVLEAASQKTPTVAFNVAGLKDIVVNGQNGYLVAEEKISELEKLLSNLLNHPQKLKRLQTSSFIWSKNLPRYPELARKFAGILKRVYDSKLH